MDRVPLLLHVGTAKTGTSLVQNQFARFDALRTTAYGYPLAGRRRPSEVAHHGIAQSVLADRSDDVEAFVHGLPLRPTLLSSEVFATAIARGPRGLSSTRQFVEALTGRGWQVELIAFVREATDFLASMYLQSVKMGTVAVPFADYVSSRRDWYDNFFANLSALRQVTPQQIFAFIPPRYGRDWQHVLAAAEPLDTAQRVNSRLSLKSLAFLSVFDDIARTTGTSLTRGQVILQLAGQGSPFDEDTVDFNIWPHELATQVWSAAQEAAQRHGVACYLDAFATGPPPARPHVELSASVLSDADRAAARDFLARMERRRHPSEARDVSDRLEAPPGRV